MGSFISYFDYLGFKDFLDRNTCQQQEMIFQSMLQDIESSLSLDQICETELGIESDISRSRIFSINFSDTVVFWTKDNSIESIEELIKVSYRFNSRSNRLSFPVRGAVVFGDIIYYDYREPTRSGGQYNINSVIGKGMVYAHEKANDLNWAGTVIDASVIDELKNRGFDISEILKALTVRYKVPYKTKTKTQNEDEFVFRLNQGDETASSLYNLKLSVEENFTNHNKSIDNDSVKEKLNNTIRFLDDSN